MNPLVNRVIPAVLALAVAVSTVFPAAADEEEAASAAAEKSQLQREEALLARVWWNQASKIQLLTLSPAQRTAMDDTFRPFIRSYNARHQAIQQERLAFSKALYQADMEAAQQLRDNVVEYQSAFVAEQVQVMMDVAALMTEEQLEQLGEAFPGLFSRNWIRPFKSGGKGRPGAGH